MAKKILVALKSEDRLSQMIPYIERNAQPGMEVIFLVRFSANACFKTPQQSLLRLKPLESVRFPEEMEDTSTTGGVKQLAPVEQEKLLVERKAILALDTLIKKGVRIAVDVYMGSLKKALKCYERKGNVHLVITRTRRVRRLARYLVCKLANTGWLRQPTIASLPLLHAHR